MHAQVLHELHEMRDPEMRDHEMREAPDPADPSSSPARAPSFLEEDEESEAVTLCIDVMRQRIKLKAQSFWDLEDLRSEILRQHKALGFRDRDLAQFCLKGNVIPESLTIKELLRQSDHRPLLDPAVDVLHANECGSPKTPLAPQQDASTLETGARVRVHSLQSAKGLQYNGQEGVLGARCEKLRRLEEQRRWTVQLFSGVSISCNPDNLVRIAAQDDKDGHYIINLGESLLPRYKILKVIGEGTFGKMTLCWDRTEKKYVAIKITKSILKYREAAKVEIEILKDIERRDKMRARCL